MDQSTVSDTANQLRPFENGRWDSLNQMLLGGFQTIPPFLPEWILQMDLLRAFIWYVSIAFAVSLSLRLRFYSSVFSVAYHVSDSCPSVYRLLTEHWFLCVKDGLLLLVGTYGGLLATYLALTRLVLPEAHTNMETLASVHPLLLVCNLCLVAAMVTVDVVLALQVGVLDADKVTADLTYSEMWLGGNLNQMLGFMGKWNPIKLYADTKVRESLVWLNEIFRNSVQIMIVQLLLRLATGGSLFGCYILSG